ncbi:hypothetical protein [Tenacibaculum amylolyticum]|uniref:hypothetical protein n=1 Tax=Tenacibaculum amylolyticum TaxID=104269 RepID=UPI003893038F
MFNIPKGYSPTKIAEMVANKYTIKGYVLDFSLKSLQQEIDRILANETTVLKNKDTLECELTAYFGETLCRLYEFSWSGTYDRMKTGINYYTCKIVRDGFEIWPSHFLGYYMNNGKDDVGSFEKYINGLLPKINNKRV